MLLSLESLKHAVFDLVNGHHVTMLFVGKSKKGGKGQKMTPLWLGFICKFLFCLDFFVYFSPFCTVINPMTGALSALGLLEYILLTKSGISHSHDGNHGACSKVRASLRFLEQTARDLL